MRKGNKMKRGFTPLEAVEQSGRNERLLTGFTLIELITVVIIIAIMAALALPQYTRFIERSQGSTARNALNMIRKAEAIYFALQSQYNNTMSVLADEVPEISKLALSSEWSYAITLQNNSVNFVATATRLKGSYGGSGGGSITITDDGVFTIINGSKQNPSGIW